MFLERWTIDQLVDNCVAVARAVYRHEIPDEDSESIAQRAVHMESEGFSSEDWAPEFVSVLDRDELLREVGSRNSARGAVARGVSEEEDPRALFEGQVLWMVTPEKLLDNRDGSPIGPGDTGWLFEHGPTRRLTSDDSSRLLRRDVDIQPGWHQASHVIDATEAARAGVKKQYEQAVASPPVHGARPSPTPAHVGVDEAAITPPESEPLDG